MKTGKERVGVDFSNSKTHGRSGFNRVQIIAVDLSRIPDKVDIDSLLKLVREQPRMRSS